MTQDDIPARCLALQLKLMDALDAAWAILERGRDPAEIRGIRDRIKAIGELAAVARKVGLITPTGRKPPLDAVAAGPASAQAEHARRGLETLKGGRRGRL